MTIPLGPGGFERWWELLSPQERDDYYKRIYEEHMRRQRGRWGGSPAPGPGQSSSGRTEYNPYDSMMQHLGFLSGLSQAEKQGVNLPNWMLVRRWTGR